MQPDVRLTAFENLGTINQAIGLRICGMTAAEISIGTG